MAAFSYLASHTRPRTSERPPWLASPPHDTDQFEPPGSREEPDGRPPDVLQGLGGHSRLGVRQATPRECRLALDHSDRPVVRLSGATGPRSAVDPRDPSAMATGTGPLTVRTGQWAWRRTA